MQSSLDVGDVEAPRSVLYISFSDDADEIINTILRYPKIRESILGESYLSTFSVDSFIDFRGFVVKLWKCEDAVSKKLRSKFSSKTKKEFDKIKDTDQLPLNALKPLLVESLNEILKTESLFDTNEIKTISLRNKTEILERKKSSWGPIDSTQSNVA